MTAMFLQRNFNNGYACGEPNTFSWQTPALTNVTAMFRGNRCFNGNMNSFDLSKVGSLYLLFEYGKFNNGCAEGDTSCPLTWNVSNVSSFQMVFYYTKFNQKISSWDVSKASTFRRMFQGNDKFNNGCSTTDATDTNCPLNWNPSRATSIREMFVGARSFNQDISSWDISKVGDFTNAFSGTNALNITNKCKIHNAFKSNSNWEAANPWSNLCP